MPTNARKSASLALKDCSPSRTWDNGVFLAARIILTEQEFTAAIRSSRWSHYVYGLCLDNGAVFYVGKGVDSRATEHARRAAQGDQSEKSRYIRAIGGRLRYTLFLQCADDVFARGYEAYLIQGHHKLLTNVAPASMSAIDRMFEPVDPFQKSIADLLLIDKYLKRADDECKAAMWSIIAGHPDVAKTLSAEVLAWMNCEAA